VETFQATVDYDGNWRGTDVSRLLGFDPDTLQVTTAAPIPENDIGLYREVQTWRRREVFLWKTTVVSTPLLFLSIYLVPGKYFLKYPRLGNGSLALWSGAPFGFVFSYIQRSTAERRFDRALGRAYRHESPVILDALTALDQASASGLVARLNQLLAEDLFVNPDFPAHRRLVALGLLLDDAGVSNFWQRAGDNASAPVQVGDQLQRATL
jgi:hypothetical protein